MKKRFFASVLLFLFTTAAHADFSPTLLKLSAPDVIQYDFDGSELEIPLTVSGTPAQLYFLVYTKGIASTVPNMRNGYLGWHHVCKVDTCVYLSGRRAIDFSPGTHVITWDGRDNDDNIVPPGEYTYYFWAFDNMTPKQKVCEAFPDTRFTQIYFQETDENGIPLNNPLYCTTIDPCFRWEIGGNPEDISLLNETTLTLPEGFEISKSSNLCLDPFDFDYFYVRAGNSETQTGAILKYLFVPNGEAVLDKDFGQDGFGMLISCPYMYEPGVATDGTYLYSADQNYQTSTEPDAELYIVNWDGDIISEIDLTSWWSRPDEAAQGKRMNSGPDQIRERNGKLFLNCYCSCIKQMVDPARYLASGDYENLFVWSNLNGDYVLDQNFEETAAVTWACNYPVSGYHYTIDADDNFFTICPAYDHGAVSFGLLGPDGIGLGWCSFQGETGWFKNGDFYIDSNTPFDGIYCDRIHYANKIAKTSHYGETDTDLYFVGHDSITGIITNQSSYIHAVNPQQDDVIGTSTEYNIQWSSFNVGRVDILFSSDGGTTWTTVTSGVNASAGQYLWNVPTTEYTDCLIKIENSDDPSVVSVNGRFAINDTYLVLTNPNGGGQYFSLNELIIQWEVNNIEKINIDISFDNGNSWETIAENIDAFTGLHKWSIIRTDTSDCLIRITDAANPAITDVSDNTFKILPSYLRIITPYESAEWLTGTKRNIRWTYQGVDTIRIEYSTDDGITWSTLVGSIDAKLGVYEWTIPLVDSDECRIRIIDIEDFADQSVSPLFTLTPPYIKVLSPNGGEVFEADVTYDINWQSLGVEHVDLHYSPDNGQTWKEIVTGFIATKNNYVWDVPYDFGNTCMVRIADSGNPSVQGTSNDVFIIEMSYINLITPAGGEVWTGRTEQRISWTASPGLRKLKIEASADGGETWRIIANEVNPSDETFMWRIPLVESDSCLVRLFVYDHSDLSSVNQEFFTLTAPEPGPGWTLYNHDDWLLGWGRGIAADPVKGLWISSGYQGASYFNGKTWEHFTTHVKDVDTIVFDHSGTAWFNLVSFDGENWEFHEQGPRYAYKTVVDHTGIIWMGSTEEGLYRYDGENWIAYTIINSNLKSNHPVALCVDNDNALWIGYGDGRQGVSRFDGTTWTHYTPEDGLHSDRILDITVSEDGHKWFGANEGICEYDGNTWKNYTSFHPADHYAQDIEVDHNGYIWAAMQHGAAYYDGREWHGYNSENAVYAISMPDWVAIDRDNVKWFITYRGVLRFQNEYPPFIDLISPEGHEYINKGEVLTIEWLSHDINTIRIDFSYNSGETWETVADEFPASNESYDWTVPNLVSEHCQVRIMDTSNHDLFDISNHTFRISAPVITIQSPNGRERWEPDTEQFIIWSGIGVENYLVEVSYNYGETWEVVGENDNRSYRWTVPEEESSQCLMRVRDAENPEIYDISDDSFSTTSTFIQVREPDGDERIVVKEILHTTWFASSNIEEVIIEFSSDNGRNWQTITDRINAKTYGYAFRVPVVESNQCKIRIYDADNPSIADISDEPFTIIKPYYWSGWGRYTVEDGIGSDFVQCIDFDHQGGVWIGTKNGGASYYDGEVWTNYTTSNSGITSNNINTLAAGKDGTIWFGSSDDVDLCCFDGEYWETCSDGPLGVYSLFVDQNNHLWIGGKDNKIYRYNASDWTNWTIPGKEKPATFAISEQDTLFVGFSGSYNSGGLFRYDNGNWIEYDALYSISKSSISDIEFDNGSTLWIGQPLTYVRAASDVVFRIPGTLLRFDGTSFFREDPTSITVNGVVEIDRNNNLWTGDHDKLFKFDGVNWETYTVEDTALPDGSINDIAVDKSNTKWIATEGGGLVTYEDKYEPYLNLLYPNGGEKWDFTHTYRIVWESQNVVLITIEITSDYLTAPQEWNVIATNVDAATGFYDYKPDIVSEKSLIKISNSNNSNIYDMSDSTFSISERVIAEKTNSLLFSVSQNVPNPFNPTSTISFTIPEAGHTVVEIYNLAGQKVAALVDGRLDAGSHTVTWDAAGFPSGIYFYNVKSGINTKSMKMLLMR
jgi:ligand-binding sensor domain-containing protein/flagellar hook assembly protein FlgD